MIGSSYMGGMVPPPSYSFCSFYYILRFHTSILWYRQCLDVLVKRCEYGIPVKERAIRNYISQVTNNIKYMLSPGVNVQYIPKCAKEAAKCGILPLTWEVVFDLLAGGVRRDVTRVIRRIETANTSSQWGHAFEAAVDHLGQMLGHPEHIPLLYLPVAPNQLERFLLLVSILISCNFKFDHAPWSEC